MWAEGAQVRWTVGSRQSSVSPDITYRWKLPDSGPSVAGEEAGRDPGASPGRTLSAKLKSLG